MSEVSPLQESFESAMRLHQAGDLAKAETIYRQVLAQEPSHADAMQMLGMLAHQVGRNDEAIQLIQRAISINPNWPDFHSNLGTVFAGLARWDEAVAAFRRALLLRPEFPEAHNNLGIVLATTKQWELAVASYRKAIELRPTYFEAHNNLGTALHEQGKFQEAIAAYRKSLELQPKLAQAHNNLGNSLRELGQLDEAIAEFGRALAIRPDFAQAHFNLGNVLRSRRRFPEAIASYRQALAIHKNFAGGYNNLGNALRDAGQLNEAMEAFQTALRLQPGLSVAAFNLGLVLQDLGKKSEAIEVYRRIVAQNPGDAETWSNLGVALESVGNMDDAEAALGQALRARPGMTEASNNLASLFKETGRTDEAIGCYQRVLPTASNSLVAYSNYLLMLHYSDNFDGSTILREMKKWDALHAQPLRKFIQPHSNDAAENRKLRIGYVSPDFCYHVVGRNILPLLREQDRNAFEIYCYHNLSSGDAITEEFRSYSNKWRNIASLSDQQVAAAIREDGIDILVDLSGHTHRNRLLMFAQKPAPVQVTFGGYPGGTGLGVMDFHLTDVYLDPPATEPGQAGITEDHYVEQLIRMPDSFWCYDPRVMGLVDGPPINESPILKNGYVTFSCLNNIGKVGDRTFALWARLLAAVPNSRMLLHAPEGSCRQRLISKLKIEPGRVEFIYRLSPRKYLEAYHRIDLALDSLPYGGHTTGLDCLWMSVPLVTRIGKTASGRAGFSHLSNLGLTDLIADSDEKFIQIATDLSRDLPRLSALRATIRQRMLASPLTNAKRFAQNVEAGFREMWRRALSKK
jgi:protein O-GlcNAc transferase